MQALGALIFHGVMITIFASLGGWLGFIAWLLIVMIVL